MNSWLLVAAGLAVLLGAAHSYLGERYILMRLFRRAPLPALFGSDVFTRRTLRFAWHLTTVTWWGIAAAFWALGRGGAGDGIRVLAVTFLVSGMITVVASRGRHLAWIVFLAIGGAIWLGAP